MAMSLISAHNMCGESHLPGWCSVCGRPHPEAHHVVPRSLGGAQGPLVHLCGRGNALFDADGRLLHHGAAEQRRLWLWWLDGSDAEAAPDVAGAWTGGWAYVLLDEPAGWMRALRAPGWRMLP